MKIVEVRDGIIKFEADNTVTLSSFIKVNGEEKSYVAQVIQVKPSDNIAFAKILFLYDGELKDYDRTSPSQEAIIEPFTSEMITNAIHYTKPVVTGKTTDNSGNIVVAFSAFNKKTMICSDNNDLKNHLLKNLIKQFNYLEKKVVIIDTLGSIEAKKYVAGRDFKLPLNKSSLMFMFEECLNDATADSKKTIVEIFKDLAEYSESVPFVPFGALKTIVDEMVDKSHVFKLLVLKNKLSKYNSFGYFAKTSDEVKKIETILKSDCAVIDVSKMDTIFQNRYISYIYETLAKSDAAVILELSNTVTKKTLKSVIDSSIATTFVSHSGFKYVSDIKSMFDNFIIFPSEGVNRLFNIYSTFLRSMDKNTYLVVGGATSYMPFISAFAPFDEKEEVKIADDEILDEINKQESELQASVETYDEEEETSDEIIAGINEKSRDTINNIADNLETPNDIDMFGEDEDIPEEENPQLQDKAEGVEENEVIADDSVVLTEEDLKEEIADEVSEEDDVTEQEDEVDTISEPDVIAYEQEEIIDESDEVISVDDVSDTSSEILADDDILNTEIELGEDFDIDLGEEVVENDIQLTEEEQIEKQQINESNEPIELETASDEIIERDVIPLDDDFNADEIVELNPEDASSDDILIDMSDDEISPEEIDEQVKKEVDKVYTTRKEDDFTDNDLDLIDELNNEGDTLIEVQEDDGILNELAEQGEIIEEYHSEELQEEKTHDEGDILETRNSTTPMVPVYDAEIPEEDLVESDPIQQGDSVNHVRFGNGVVEKLVKYGSKTLFMINFDNGGRRLLDPLLTEIKKV
ncbi:hypothetical protein IKQ21_07935 [bacterium]|nr:hypothetical protein [bacterium]